MEFGNRKNLIIALSVLAVLAIGGLITFSTGGDDADKSGDVAAELREGEVKIMGKIECLPYRIVGANQECVKGIKGDDGRIYAIDSADVGFIENDMEEGTKVQAEGELVAADADNKESSVFSYDGVLELSSLKER